MLIETCKANPVDVFRKLYHRPYSFFLDSCGLNRYSYVGADPFALIKAQGNKVEIVQDSMIRVSNFDIFSVLSSILTEFYSPASRAKGRLFPFQGGAVGYFGYELKNQLEELPRKKAVAPITPDSIFGLYDTIFTYDHKTNKGYIFSSGLPEKNKRLRQARAKERIHQFLKDIKTGCSEKLPLAHPSPLMGEGKGVGADSGIQNFKSNFTRSGYIRTIQSIQRYIAAGDIYQANLSQRLSIDFHGDPLLFYSKLRTINPAQFGAFLNNGDFQIISNSPERLLKVSNGIAETSPIKGTRPRGKNLKEDRALIQELRTNAKELAEHIMIVDLERNDLGKVCEYDSIKVQPMHKIYTYATLHHMVSTVSGKLRDGINPLDCVKAVFPGGSVTGAPKIRAMEIIERLEPTPRGLYTGGIGYIDFSENMDMAMTIRTGVLKDNRLYLSVGGGIVADSNPEKEYEETILKASAFLRAMGVGQKNRLRLRLRK